MEETIEINQEQRKYVIAGGLNFKDLEENMNFYAKEGFKVISEIQTFSEKEYQGYVVLMEWTPPKPVFGL